MIKGHAFMVVFVLEVGIKRDFTLLFHTRFLFSLSSS
ncbi:hypothetical protein LINGRAHAP2_LOCUS32573 [Linum grandiflorum]